MTLQIPVGYALASFGGFIAFDAEEVFFTMGFEITANPTAAMAEDLYDVWANALDTLSSTDWTFNSCYLKAGPNATGPTAEFTGGTVAGTVAQATIPVNTSVLVRKTTGLGGRKGRGRAYTVGQLYVNTIGGAGIIDSGHLGFLDTNWLAILGGWQSVVGIADVVLLHSDSTAPTPITALTPQPKAATQRRRLRP